MSFFYLDRDLDRLLETERDREGLLDGDRLPDLDLDRDPEAERDRFD